MLVGEIGIPRRDFLYEISLWEVQKIISGYRRRNILTYQLLRLNAYMSCFSMRENKWGKTPQDWLPMDFDSDSDDDDPPISEEEQQELINLIDNVNVHNS